MNPQDNGTSGIDDQSYEASFEHVFEKEAKSFESLSKTKLVISLIGDANAGKSATINALTERKLSSVNPISGWTKEISLYPYSENVFIADTPGLHDTSTSELAAKAHQFVEKDTDIILFFVNAASNRSLEEDQAFRAVLKLGKPTVVVLNKIDTIEPEYVDSVVADLKQRFDYELVIPISATKDQNVAFLSYKITEILAEKGKDLLFLKISKYKEDDVRVWINSAAISAAGIGAIPLPGADIIPLTALQVALCLKIAYIYNCKVSKGDVLQLISSTVTGVVGKSLFRNSIKLLGGILGPLGAITTATVAAGIAGSMTLGLGWAANAYYKSGMTIDLGEVAEIYKNAYKTGEMLS